MQGPPFLESRRVAVITGAASGIGFAAAHRFAALGMRLCLADHDSAALAEAARGLEQVLLDGPNDLRIVTADVAKREDVARLADLAFDAFGDVGLLMNNAAIGRGAGPWENVEQWRRLLDVNFFNIELFFGLHMLSPPLAAQGYYSIIG